MSIGFASLEYPAAPRVRPFTASLLFASLWSLYISSGQATKGVPQHGVSTCLRAVAAVPAPVPGPLAGAECAAAARDPGPTDLRPRLLQVPTYMYTQ